MSPPLARAPMPRPAVTQMLVAASAGDQEAAEQLWPLVYDELRRMAHRELYRERRGQTFSTTALVHDAYFKLVDVPAVAWRDRAHFFAIACRAMRQILVDRARYRQAEKRAARQDEITLPSAVALAASGPHDLIDLDRALTRLSSYNPRLAQVVEYRFFGGLSVEETAELLGTSVRTVERDWKRAKAYLRRWLGPT